jgi:hypothetical protein
MLNRPAAISQERTLSVHNRAPPCPPTIHCMRKLLPAIILLALSIALSGCDPCGNEISQTFASPSGKLKAVVFNRDCGATTGFSTQVSIIPSSESLPGAGGNTLILDGTVPLKVEWRSDSELHLSGLGAAKIFLQSPSTAGVSVSYGG